MSEERNYGIDLLRIISMCFIVMLHFLGHGGVLHSSTEGTINWATAYLLQTIAYSGVCIFGTISGYVGFSKKRKKHRFRRIIVLWMEVAFYSFTISMMTYILTNSVVNLSDVIKSMFPIATNTYWYFTAYFLLYILMPWLDTMIAESNTRTIWIILLSGALFMYFSHVLDGLFGLSVLVFCYIIGAAIKKYGIVERISRKKVGFLIISLLSITWLWRIIIGLLNSRVGSILLRYDSPTIIIASSGFVIYFSKIKIPEWMKNKITVVASSAFSIYLLNDHPLVRKCLIEGRFSWLNEKPIWTMIVVIFGSAVLFLLLSIIIDMIRKLIFRIIHIETIATMIEKLYIQFAVKFGGFAMSMGKKILKNR